MGGGLVGCGALSGGPKNTKNSVFVRFNYFFVHTETFNKFTFFFDQCTFNIGTDYLLADSCCFAVGCPLLTADKCRYWQSTQ